MAHVLVTGGVRSGKSRYAESLLPSDAPVSYLTPGYPADPDADAEWAARVATHQLRRPPAWRTVETLDLGYVIICRGFIGPARKHAPGMEGLEHVAALHEVYRNADATIYRIDRSRFAAS